MWLKTAILVVFLALVASLASGLFFLVKDQGKTRRTLYSLGVRVCLAVILLALVGYGIVTGQLRSKAPWSESNRQLQSNQDSATPTSD